MLRRGLVPGLLAFAALTAVGRAALAWDALAEPCQQDLWRCETGKVHFEHLDQLPIEFQFDTGWVPQNSDVQIHVWAAVYAHTRIELTGNLETTWPGALTFHTPGDPWGGYFAYHYGVETGAEGMVTVEWDGNTYTWKSDIPYVPQIDFQVDADTVFNAWGFPPGVTLTSKTQPQKVVSMSIEDLIGQDIPGADGGFELDIAMEVKATYTTTEIGLEHDDGTPVDGGKITSELGASSDPYLGGAAIDVNVHPKGTVDYDGVLHLIPALYATAFGNDYTIPIADIPIPFPITQTDVDFGRQQVHVPLPDLVLPKTVIDFGDVPIGEKKLALYTAIDAGEADAIADVESDDPEQFPVYDDAFQVKSGDTFSSAVRFAPVKAGPQSATIHVWSNDPSDPVQTFVVKGNGVGPSLELPDDDAGEAKAIGEDGGCACRTAGDRDPTPAAAFASLALGALVLRRRRRP